MMVSSSLSIFLFVLCHRTLYFSFSKTYGGGEDDDFHDEEFNDEEEGGAGREKRQKVDGADKATRDALIRDAERTIGDYNDSCWFGTPSSFLMYNLAATQSKASNESLWFVLFCVCHLF